LGANKKALKVIPEPEIYDIIVSKHIKHLGQKKTYRIKAAEVEGEEDNRTGKAGAGRRNLNRNYTKPN